MEENLKGKQDVVMVIIGDNIKRIRQQQHIKQYELAEQLNVTQPTVAQWEQGKRIPQADRLVEIADVLKCSVEDLTETECGLSGRLLLVDYSKEYYASVCRLKELIKDDPDPVFKEALKFAINRLYYQRGKIVSEMFLTSRELREYYSWKRENPKQREVVFWRMQHPNWYDMEMNLRLEITKAIQRVYKDDKETMLHLLIVPNKYSDVKFVI